MNFYDLFHEATRNGAATDFLGDDDGDSLDALGDTGDWQGVLDRLRWACDSRFDAAKAYVAGRVDEQQNEDGRPGVVHCDVGAGTLRMRRVERVRVGLEQALRLELGAAFVSLHRYGREHAVVVLETPPGYGKVEVRAYLAPTLAGGDPEPWRAVLDAGVWAVVAGRKQFGFRGSDLGGQVECERIAALLNADDEAQRYRAAAPDPVADWSDERLDAWLYTRLVAEAASKVASEKLLVPGE
jgi:hypothetical protein